MTTIKPEKPARYLITWKMADGTPLYLKLIQPPATSKAMPTYLSCTSRRHEATAFTDRETGLRIWLEMMAGEFSDDPGTREKYEQDIRSGRVRAEPVDQAELDFADSDVRMVRKSKQNLEASI